MFLNKAPRSAASYDVAGIEKLLNGYASDGTTVEVCFPDDFAGSGVEGVIGDQKKLNGLDHMMDLPALIRKTMWAAENGYDAVIQSNTFDPGVDGGRLVVDIPVLGPLRTTIHAASILADRIGLPCRWHPMFPIRGGFCAVTAWIKWSPIFAPWAFTAPISRSAGMK